VLWEQLKDLGVEIEPEPAEFQELPSRIALVLTELNAVALISSYFRLIMFTIWTSLTYRLMMRSRL
jgi:hypothetical protein